MTAIGPAAEAVYDNPLIPNAKLRRMYAAMVRARLLSKALAGKRRGDAVLGIEACLVSTAIDLGPGDFISDSVTGGTVDFLRSAKPVWVAGDTSQVLRDTTLESVLRPNERTAKPGLRADCGAPSRLPVIAENEARIWSAMGAALALKSLHANRKAAAKKGEALSDGDVAVVYARPGEATPGLWRRALGFAAEQALPVLFVVLPATHKRGMAKAARAGAMPMVASRHGIPGMAVDADDAVALYRVAQESIGRARIGGGAALIECVPFILEATKSRRLASADAIAGLEQYMLSRGIATKSWFEREAAACAKRIAR